MKRLILCLIALGIMSVGLADELLAHGGQFRGPGGAVPPELRDPTDPEPPPPPPPTGPPTTPGTPDTPPPTPAGPTTPTTPSPAGPPPTTTGTGTMPGNKRPTGKKGSIDFGDWVFWYDYNKDQIENLKEKLYTRVGSQNPLFELGGSRSRGNQGDSMQDIRRLVEEKIIPTLYWAMDPENSDHQDTESAAYIALAKMMKSPADFDRIMKGLDKKLDRDQITQESAALALGLTRRAERRNQFSAADYDKARTFLFKIIDDDDYAHRVRGFATLAIGLLGDMPTGSRDYLGISAGDEAAMTDAAAKATTAALFERLKGKYSAQDVPACLFMAIGMQPPSSISPEHIEELRTAVTKGRIFKNKMQGVIRSYATLALGRLGQKKDIQVLGDVLRSRRNKNLNVWRSAAIGLGLLAKQVEGEERVELAKVLMDVAGKRSKVSDNSTKNYAYISLAYILNEEYKAKRTDVIASKLKVHEFLLEEAADGKYIHRPYAALALGLNVWKIGDKVDAKAYGFYRTKALEVLRDGLVSRKFDKRTRAAFACALGIGRDANSKTQLIEFVSDTREDQTLRGFSAVALGLIGQSLGPVKKAIREALKENRGAEMRQRCAVALGLLRDNEAMDLLNEKLNKANTQSEKGQLVLAIAKIGNEKAVDPLIKLLKNKKENDLTRALACAGLGVIGDLEAYPSLSRISNNVNYRASIDSMNEVLSIL